MLPKDFSLEQNYPNPFNPATKIRFAIPSGENVKVRLTIFDILGEEIEVLVNEEKSSGYYEVNFNSKNYPSGTYIYELQAGEFTARRKMVLIK